MSRRSGPNLPLLLVAGLAAAILAGCAAGPAERAGLRPVLEAGPTDEAPPAEISLYGLFLAGEAALEKGSSRDAAFYLSRASELAPDTAFLKERAFTAALVAGEIDQAAVLAPGPEEGTPATQRLGRLAQAVQQLASGRGAEALAILETIPGEGQTAAAASLLKPWAAAMAGDWQAAVEAPNSANRLVTVFGALGRARLLEHAGKHAEAEGVYAGLAADPDNGIFALGYGQFLERRGRRAQAARIYEAALSAGRDLGLEQALERVRSGRSAAPQVSLKQGAAEALLAPAALMMARRQPEIALAHLRLALHLDPQHDEVWMLVGDAMSNAGDRAAAREAYARVRPSSPEHPSAQGRLAWSLQQEGDSEGALKLARDNLDRSKGSVQALSVYADLLRENGRYGEAISILDTLIDRGGRGPEGWRLYYMRGVANERAGRWERAELDLLDALKLKPDEPDVMNYLAFGWADRNQRLGEALAMLQKAVALRPRSGEIRDSLGWARYRLGEYDAAVRDLERAVQMTPADPSINDHLGDAYWRTGRRLEAEFQWRRVLSLDPDPDLRAAVEAKLEAGLDAPAAARPAELAAAEPSRP